MSTPADTSAQDQEAALSWRTLVGRRSDHASALLARLMRGRSRDSPVLLGQPLMVALGTVFILTMPLPVWAAMAFPGLREGTAAPYGGFWVMVCDLDHVKALDDRRGHTVGDRVLADLGTLLLTGLREGDHAARYGGEELALLLPATTATLTPGTSPFEVLAAADAALHVAEAEGRSCSRDAAAAQQTGSVARRGPPPALAHRGEGAHTGRTRPATRSPP